MKLNGWDINFYNYGIRKWIEFKELSNYQIIRKKKIEPPDEVFYCQLIILYTVEEGTWGVIMWKTIERTKLNALL